MRAATDRLLVPRTRRDEAELMDLPGQDRAELVVNLRDIRRVNRLLGGTAVVLRHLPRLIEAALEQPSPPSPLSQSWERGSSLSDPRPALGEGGPDRGRVRATPPATILDLATGSGDIPVAIADWAKRRGLSVSIIASDVAPAMLDLAMDQVIGYPEISLARYDALAVPLPDQAVDIVLCSLALHHFPPNEAVRLLREMQRLAKVGFIVNDLRRSWLGYAAAWVAAQLTTRNRLTRNDAPLSVLRSYTPDELSDLLRQAGITNATVSTHPWFRMAAVAIKDTPDA